MENSPFAKLPRELRDQITEYALTAEDGTLVLPIQMRRDRDDIYHDETQETRGCSRKFAPMLRPTWSETCRQAREESGTLYYSINGLMFTSNHNFEYKHVIARDATTRLASLISLNAQAIRNIHFDLGFCFSKAFTNTPASLRKTIRKLREMSEWHDYSNAAITVKITFVFYGRIIRLSPEGQKGGLDVRNKPPHHYDWLVDSDVVPFTFSIRDVGGIKLDEAIDRSLQSLVSMHLADDATEMVKAEAEDFVETWEMAMSDLLGGQRPPSKPWLLNEEFDRFEKFDTDDEDENQESRQESIEGTGHGQRYSGTQEASHGPHW